jgi:hypothetical protein
MEFVPSRPAVSGYLLAMALMLPLNGWLVDLTGAKRLLNSLLLKVHIALDCTCRVASH